MNIVSAKIFCKTKKKKKKARSYVQKCQILHIDEKFVKTVFEIFRQTAYSLLLKPHKNFEFC